MDLQWGQGVNDWIMTSEGHKVLPYSSFDEAKVVHSAFGGKCYYTSRSGLSGAGYVPDTAPIVKAPIVIGDWKWMGGHEFFRETPSGFDVGLGNGNGTLQFPSEDCHTIERCGHTIRMFSDIYGNKCPMSLVYKNIPKEWVYVPPNYKNMVVGESFLASYPQIYLHHHHTKFSIMTAFGLVDWGTLSADGVATCIHQGWVSHPHIEQSWWRRKGDQPEMAIVLEWDNCANCFWVFYRDVVDVLGIRQLPSFIPHDRLPYSRLFPSGRIYFCGDDATVAAGYQDQLMFISKDGEKVYGTEYEFHERGIETGYSTYVEAEDTDKASI